MPKKPQPPISTKRLTSLEFVKDLPKFENQIEHIADHFDVEKEEIWKELCVLTKLPNLATPIPNQNPLRKFRVRIPGKTGKSVGLLVICVIADDIKRIVPLHIFTKSEKEDLTMKEYEKLRKEYEEIIEDLKANLKKI
jgi:hypothetical protein